MNIHMARGETGYWMGRYLYDPRIVHCPSHYAVQMNWIERESIARGGIMPENDEILQMDAMDVIDALRDGLPIYPCCCCCCYFEQEHEDGSVCAV